MRRKIFILFILFISCFLQAQNPTAEENNSKQTLGSIMQDVDNRFDGKTRIEGLPKYKHFARWSYWWSSRVNPDGTFTEVNKLNEKAYEKWERSNSSANRSSEANWEFLGPDLSTYANNGSHCKGNGYGRVDRITFHPTDQNKLYVCTPNGGAWYSPDAGSNWTCLTNNLPVLACAGMVVDYDDPNTLYLLSGTADNHFASSFLTRFGYRFSSVGIFKSEDHGTNWEKIMIFDSLAMNPTGAQRIKMHPLDHNKILVATDNGLYMSGDKGESWELQFAGYCTDIEFHPTNQDYIYVSGRGLIQYSDDGGATWNTSSGVTFCNDNFGNIVRSEIAVSPDDPDDVWLIAGPGFNNNTFCGLYQSTDKGLNFTTMNTAPDILGYTGNTYNDQSNYDLCIAVDDNNDQRVVVGGIQIFRNNNFETNPASWTNIASYWETTGSQSGTLPTNYVHPDVHDLAFNELDGKLYACSDGGVYVSTNNGTTWTNISQGIHTSQLFNLNLAPSNASKIGIGLQDNGVKIRQSSSSMDFNHVQSGDGFDPVFDPSNSDRVVSSINRVVYLYADIDQDNRLQLDNSTTDQWFAPVRFRPGASNIVYMGESPLRISSFTNTSSSVTSSVTNNSSASWEIETCEV